MSFQSFSITPAPTAAPGFSGSPSSGVSRYTAAPAAPESPDTPFGQNSQTVDHSTVQRCTSADLGSDNAIHAISPTGRPLAPSEIAPGTLVTIGGVEMKAVLAERLGLLTRVAHGYGLASAGTQAETNKTDAETKATDADTADSAPALPEAAAASLETLNAGGQDTVGASLEYLDTGELSPGTVARLASRLSLEPEQVLAHAEAVAAGFQSVASGLLGGDEAIELAAEFFPGALEAAFQSHAMRGDVSGYKELAAKVIDHRISSAPKIECSDPTVTVRTAHGRHLVSGRGIPGEIDLKQAVRMGLFEIA